MALISKRWAWCWRMSWCACSRAARRRSQWFSGGLAAWQQRIVTTYIEEHLAEPILLATLAELARLSTYHFCRAFKQSLGLPPHRYHTSRRIDHAKTLLAKPAPSVTEIGMDRRLQRDELLHRRVPQGHRTYAERLSPEPRLTTSSNLPKRSPAKQGHRISSMISRLIRP